VDDSQNLVIDDVPNLHQVVTVPYCFMIKMAEFLYDWYLR